MRRALVVLMLLSAGCGQPEPQTTAGSRPNLLLITVDTLRADRLGAYGYTAIETPAADGLARLGVLLEDATVQAPQTLPSHVSIFTGRYPHEHGVRDNFAAPLAEDVPTLASEFQRAGYATAAFIGALPVSGHSGLARGFDVYDDPFAELKFAETFTQPARSGEDVVSAALEWLEQGQGPPFLAWVHLYDPHEPYEPPAPYDQRYAGRPYDGEVAYADAQVGRLLDFLERSGLRQRTLVVLTSDHGEGLGEHGEDEHLMFVYDSTLRVPLILSWPGVLPEGRRVAGQFRSVDLLPTLLELAGLPGVETTGASRAASLSSGEELPANESYAESLFGSLHYGFAPLKALRSGQWKYVAAPRPELYDLHSDPGETTNLFQRRRRTAAQMQERLAAYGDGAGAALATPDPQVHSGLLALGYLGGGAPTPARPDAPDPKDRMSQYQTHVRDSRQALRFFGQGDVDRALPLLERLAQGSFPSFEVQYFLGRCLMQRRRYPEAAGHLARALELQPAFAPGYAELGLLYHRLGRPQQARETVDKGLALDGENAALLAVRGLFLHQAGDLLGAARSLERAKAGDARNFQARLALAMVYRDQGQVERAIAELRAAVQEGPRFAAGWNALGELLGAAGREAEALTAFEAAVSVAPHAPAFAVNLALAQLRTGRREQALAQLRRVRERFPNYAPARELLARAGRRPPPAAQRPAKETLHLRLLVVASPEAARAVAQRLAGGESFDALARELSTDPSASRGGDIGRLAVTDLAEPLRSAAARLQPGQVSPVLRHPAGFALLKREP